MVNYLLKKSYQLRNLKEIEFKDLWGDHGVFTTMWIFGRPPKILFFQNHIKNLVQSLGHYGIKKRFLKKEIIRLINLNIKKKFKYNHLLRIALNKKTISISLRKRLTPKLDFNLKLVNFKREKPKYKNLKYKKILSYLSKMDNTKSDIALINNNCLLETGTSNLLFVKDKKIYMPKKDYYKGITYKFLKSKIKKIFKKDIFIKDLSKYDEILLVGSGKGIASVKSINEINWKRKDLSQFRKFSNYYRLAIKKTKIYRF